MGTNELLSGSLAPINLYSSVKYKIDFRKEHPEYFDPEGLMVFCGPQGSGKTISAVAYCLNIMRQYPECKFVTNVEIKNPPPVKEIIEYDGLDSLFDISNGYAGVLYLIDEFHLEWNSLESKNISIEEMIEFSQQRKQRKHIVGTSQVYMRLAKPLREQIKNIVLCENYYGLVQHNQLIDGTTAIEENGKLKCDVHANQWWFHSPDLYACYDTYAKMKRYKKEWKGRKQGGKNLFPDGVFSPDDLQRIGSHLGGV